MERKDQIDNFIQRFERYARANLWREENWTHNKNFRKRRPPGAQLLFLYEVSIIVLIDFIAILLTPGIFLIQICIQFIFIVKILKYIFPKAIVEETLTSGKYISMFLISILNIYIYMKLK